MTKCFGLESALELTLTGRDSDGESAVEHLLRAKLTQNKILSMLRGEDDEMRKQRKLAADIRFKIGEYFLEVGGDKEKKVRASPQSVIP